MRKPFYEYQIEKLKINVKMPYVNKKPVVRNENLVQTKKLGLE